MSVQTPTGEQIRDAWEALAEEFDQYVTPQNVASGEQVLRRAELGPGTRFLDVGAGSGALSIPAARRGADVLAVDIAPGMVDRLARRAGTEGLTNLRTQVMDGQSLELDDNTFDVSASQHGVSLFPDLSGGLAELVRVTKAGGHVLVVAFGPIQQAEFLSFFMRAIRAAVPGITPPPMDPPPLPFQVSDPRVLGQRLTDAALRDVQVDAITSDTRYESALSFWNTVSSSNPMAAAMDRSLTADQRSDAQTVLSGMFRERSGGQPGAVLHTALNIATGTK